QHPDPGKHGGGRRLPGGWLAAQEPPTADARGAAGASRGRGSLRPQGGAVPGAIASAIPGRLIADGQAQHEGIDPLRIHYLQHVPFEDPGSLLPALANLGHGVAGSHPYRGDPLPRVDDFDALIIMGGPMGAEDEAIHPWLAAEKALIGEVCRHTAKPVLGICLGAQLIASALGAPVTRNPQPEIGWFPLHLDDAFAASPWGQCFDDGAPVFHWHGDTFALP